MIEDGHEWGSAGRVRFTRDFGVIDVPIAPLGLFSKLDLFYAKRQSPRCISDETF
jgi:hypothetical protein